MAIPQDVFGSVGDTPVERYTLTNNQGVQAQIITYGGIVTSLRAPDRDGNVADVVLGFDTLEPYLDQHPYFGALIGRYGNRIAHGRFELDGVSYQLACNNGPNHLHGGERGFDKVIWQAQPREQNNTPSLELSYHSRDGEEGYPGNLDVTVVYTLTEQNDLRIDYHATTDQATIVNLTNHSYFNLAGTGDVLDHQIQVAARYFLPVDETSIPTGERQDVRGTPFDFTHLTRLGDRAYQDDPQLNIMLGGIDHTFVLDDSPIATRVYHPGNGRLLTVTTTQPGMHLYTGNFLDGSLVGRDQQVYAKHAGLCLETQHFPDSPNRAAFPSTVLRPGEIYHHTTVYRLGVQEAT